jgi:hypothetical protein
MKQALLIFLFLTGSLCKAQNLIPNGDFETGPGSSSVGWQYALTSSCGLINGTAGPTSWSVTNLTPDRLIEGRIYCNWDNDTAASGSAFIVLGNTEAGKVTLSQPLIAGYQYTLSACLQKETMRGTVSGTPRIAFIFNNSGNSIYSPYISNSTSWTTYTVSFTATAASTELELRGLVSNTGMEIDKVSLIRITTLPIVLVGFDAEKKDDTAHLSWTTSSEINNDFFSIERAFNMNEADGTVWEEIASVDGAGNSSATNTYHFEDKNIPNTKIYYRLKQVDFDGQFSYSSIRTVDGKQESVITAMPNPFTGSFKLNSNAEGTAMLYDSFGRQVKSEEIAQGNTEINTEDLAAGIYYLLFSGNKAESIKLVKE